MLCLLSLLRLWHRTCSRGHGCLQQWVSRERVGGSIPDSCRLNLMCDKDRYCASNLYKNNDIVWWNMFDYTCSWPLTSLIGPYSPGSDLSPCASLTVTATQHQWARCVAPTGSPTSQPALLAAPNQWVDTISWRRSCVISSLTLSALIETCCRSHSWIATFWSHFLCLCQNLTSCTCISSTSEDAVALPGKCPSPGCQEAFLTFLCVICVCSMIGAMAQTPSVIILIRQVDLLLHMCCPLEGAVVAPFSCPVTMWNKMTQNRLELKGDEYHLT